MSQLSQMMALVQQFLAGAVGMAVAVAFTRWLTRRRQRTLGSFCVDKVRSITRALLPIPFVFSVALCRRGHPDLHGEHHGAHLAVQAVGLATSNRRGQAVTSQSLPGGPATPRHAQPRHAPRRPPRPHKFAPWSVEFCGPAGAAPERPRFYAGPRRAGPRRAGRRQSPNPGKGLFHREPLVPKAATFVRGSVHNGVLGVQFRDPATGATFSMFVGHPGTKKVSCPGTVLEIGPARHICDGRTSSASMAQFLVQNLMYTMAVSPLAGPPGNDVTSNQDVVIRIVSSMANDKVAGHPQHGSGGVIAASLAEGVRRR